MAADAVSSEATEGTAPAEDDGALETASELKAQGNEAYKREDVKVAVEYWNRALRRHIDAIEKGQEPAISEVSQSLERSLYLNLAQGYLKLGQPERALRACQVVAMERPTDAKVCYRAAEACLDLKRHDDALQWLKKLLEAEPHQAEAARLLSRVQAARRTEAQRQKLIAQRMCAATEGFAEGRAAGAEGNQAGALSSSSRGFLDADPLQVEGALDVASAAARAARAREERLSAPSLPEPATRDLDAFRAKVAAKSRSYASFVDRSRKQREKSQQSVRLEWLRGGRDGTDFDTFAAPLRSELSALEEQDRAAAAAAEELEEEAERPNLGRGEGLDGGPQGASALVSAPREPVERLQEMD
mmetsp:Transcript_49236/g.107096  ORF Transcript_49236/g.107096 Transcript_49236/m.107096 type:complete len:359 (+) Transcript_49236:55-1131(+)|eukprot:CAMPEP_0170616410 /NCGR_PEP_ID=MMETSP0224-20130122/25855_1 /TAXON_ID=285029 /ORGANISM="Togula jolla, Strain CCCM 725" /LENGTH=358 /DNA_ID=CAMNT_0010942205 /DNA_START=55 /DNA_END=1131 /DNA_ORIENTATION=+